MNFDFPPCTTKMNINNYNALTGINHDRVFANRLLFDENGNYAGFDPNEMTSDSGTKDVSLK